MDERYFKDKISAYLDNELSPQERTIVDEYIRTHPEAQEQLAKLESLKRMSKAHLALGGDDLYWERNARKIESAIGTTSRMESAVPSKPGWHSHWGKLAAVAASVGILFFIAINKDEVEKKILPPSSPIIESTEETSRDSVAPILSAPTPVIEKEKRVEKEVQLHKGAEPAPKSVELKGKAEEIEVTTEQPVSEKSDFVAPKEVQRKGIESIMPQISIPISRLSNTRSQNVEVADSVSSTTSADLVAEAKSDSVVLTLEKWMNIRDSLVPVLAELEAQELKSRLADKTKNDIQRSIDDEWKLNVDALDAPQSPERVWLDANYHIAEMTSDLVQKVSAIEALKSYEKHSNFAVRTKASEYLKKLTD